MSLPFYLTKKEVLGLFLNSIRMFIIIQRQKYTGGEKREKGFGIKAKKIIYAIGIAEDQRRNNYIHLKRHNI